MPAMPPRAAFALLLLLAPVSAAAAETGTVRFDPAGDAAAGVPER